MYLSLYYIFYRLFFIKQGANEGGKNYGDEYLAELDYVEVVEGIKEGYESDVLESEMPMSDTTEDKKKSADASEEEDNTKETDEANSDEDFNINNYVSCNKDLMDTAESSSIRYPSRNIFNSTIYVSDN